MGRGGARPGSGRKPKDRRVVLNMLPPRSRAEIPILPAVDADERARLVEPPSDLPAEVQACWRRCAGHAVTERTLTSSTAEGFRQFCQQWAYLADIEKRIQQLGAGTKEADPYLKTYIKLAQRVDSSLARFKLTAFGKPATSDKPKPAANPWAQVAAK